MINTLFLDAEPLSCWQVGVSKLWPAVSGCVQPSSVHSTALPVSAPLCLPIYQRELLSWHLGAGVGERWKQRLIARKNLQLCFTLYRTGCCGCQCWSASAAASRQILSPPHKNTCLLPVLQKRPGHYRYSWILSFKWNFQKDRKKKSSGTSTASVHPITTRFSYTLFPFIILIFNDSLNDFN